jgi:four helix bundle protein
MAVGKYEDLIAWQLGMRLHSRVLELTARVAAQDDGEFRNHLREASSAVPANIAEGFGRWGHREFLQFLRVARGSVNETGTRLRDGHLRGYWSDGELQDALLLVRRTGICITRLIEAIQQRHGRDRTP